MIVYKRDLNREDIKNLANGEELIYYKNEGIAITVNQIDNFYIVRKKEISSNKLLEELKLEAIEEIVEFALN